MAPLPWAELSWVSCGLVAQIHPGLPVEKDHLAGVPAETDSVFDLDVDLGRNAGAHQHAAGAKRQDLLDAVVLDVVDFRLDGRTGLDAHILGPDAEGVVAFA